MLVSASPCFRGGESFFARPCACRIDGKVLDERERGKLATDPSLSTPYVLIQSVARNHRLHMDPLWTDFVERHWLLLDRKPPTTFFVTHAGPSSRIWIALSALPVVEWYGSLRLWDEHERLHQINAEFEMCMQQLLKFVNGRDDLTYALLMACTGGATASSPVRSDL